MTTLPTAHLPAWLASKLDRTTSPHGCWMWTGRLDDKGYGRVSIPGGKSSVLAHRAVYAATRGPLTQDQHLLHQCDVHHPGIVGRRCCNPDHLVIGDARSNAEDRSRKGRSPRQVPKSPGAPPERRWW